MQLVNPLTAYPIGAQVENINGVPMRGQKEKQGWSFSRAGYLAACDDPTINPDKFGAMLRKQLRPLSLPTLVKARAEYEGREVQPLPRYLICENTGICNRACPFCSISVIKRYDENGNAGKLVMEWQDFYKLMEEYSHNDGHYGASIYGLGEPTLWRGKDENGRALDVADMVDLAKGLGKFRAVNISTNGDVNNLHRLLECDLDDLIISIEGMTEEVYLQNRPPSNKRQVNAFQSTLDRVHAFLEWKAKRGQPKPYTRLQMINMSSTAPQVLDFIRYWIQVDGVDSVLIKHLDGMTPWVGTAAVGEEEAAIKMEQVKSMPCQHIFSILAITASGSLVGCCHDARSELWEFLPDGRFPHIKNMTAREWWNGDFMTKLRGEHTSGVFRAPCKLCAERDPWL